MLVNVATNVFQDEDVPACESGKTAAGVVAGAAPQSDWVFAAAALGMIQGRSGT